MTPGLTQLARTIRATPNKGRMHVFLGHPDSDGGDKTVVEPGNTFSPGLGTCGVSVWIETVDGRLWTPDTLADEAVTWGFTDERDGPPVLNTHWAAGEGVEVSSRLCHLGGAGSEGVDFCEVQVAASEGTGRIEGVCTLVVRDIGPAGAKIESLDWNADALTLQVGSDPRIVVEDAPQSVVIVPADARFDSPLALLRYPFTLAPGQALPLSFKAEHGFAGRAGVGQLSLSRPYTTLTVAQGITRSCQDWIGRRPGRLVCPDARLTRVWDRSAYHLQAAMENGLPRSGAAEYPAFEMREDALVLRALDVMGRADLGRAGCDALAPLAFIGGFKAAADAPAKDLWALVSHAQITQDFAWLAPHFGQIKRRVEWLERLADADAPARRVGENRPPPYAAMPGGNLRGPSAGNGLIRGRVEPPALDFSINCWAVAGFRLAAEAADALGHGGLARAWTDRADRLEDALAEYLLPAYGNERDPTVTPYPAGVLSGRRADLRAKFETWFHTRRPGFEAALVHNAFRLGLDDLAWTALVGLLDKGGTASWDVSAFGEGLPGGSGGVCRGWRNSQASPAGSMPHGWTAAGWILLLRDLFVRDDGSRLLLGPHIPRAWRLPGAQFGIRDLPTRFGLVSYLATVGDAGEVDLEYEGPEDYEAGWANYRVGE